MRIDDKRKVLAYLKANNDNTATASELISLMEDECESVDVCDFSLSAEYLKRVFGEELAEDDEKIKALKRHFGKESIDDITLDELEELADALMPDPYDYADYDAISYGIDMLCVNDEDEETNEEIEKVKKEIDWCENNIASIEGGIQELKNQISCNEDYIKQFETRKKELEELKENLSRKK